MVKRDLALELNAVPAIQADGPWLTMPKMASTAFCQNVRRWLVHKGNGRSSSILFVCNCWTCRWAGERTQKELERALRLFEVAEVIWTTTVPWDAKVRVRLQERWKRAGAA